MWNRDLSGPRTGFEFLPQQNPEASNPGGRLQDLTPACAQLSSLTQGHANQRANPPPATTLPWVVTTEDKVSTPIAGVQRKKKWQRRDQERQGPWPQIPTRTQSQGNSLLLKPELETHACPVPPNRGLILPALPMSRQPQVPVGLTHFHENHSSQTCRAGRSPEVI